MGLDLFLGHGPDLFPRCRYSELQRIVIGTGAAIETDDLADLER